MTLIHFTALRDASASVPNSALPPRWSRGGSRGGGAGEEPPVRHTLRRPVRDQSAIPEKRSVVSSASDVRDQPIVTKCPHRASARSGPHRREARPDVPNSCRGVGRARFRGGGRPSAPRRAAEGGPEIPALAAGGAGE